MKVQPQKGYRTMSMGTLCATTKQTLQSEEIDLSCQMSQLRTSKILLIILLVPPVGVAIWRRRTEVIIRKPTQRATSRPVPRAISIYSLYNILSQASNQILNKNIYLGLQIYTHNLGSFNGISCQLRRRPTRSYGNFNLICGWFFQYRNPCSLFFSILDAENFFGPYFAPRNNNPKYHVFST